MNNLIKQAVRLLPGAFQEKLKLKHYSRVVDKVTDEEEPDFQVVRQLVSSGDNVIDIGANIGVYSFLFSTLVGNEGRVSSFEPIKNTFSYLRNNVQVHKLQNVEVFNSAVSDFEGEVEMEVPLEGNDKNIYRSHIVEVSQSTSGQVEKVACTTVDNKFLDSECRISFIKIDVEGHELSVLKGAVGLLKRDMPSLLIEIDGDLSSQTGQANKVLSFLSELGYRGPYREDNGKLKLRGEDISVNYFFLSKEELGKINFLT